MHRSSPARAAGWIPNQHGAWAMVITPWLLGLAWALGESRFTARHVALLAFWLVGYFAFFSVSLWLKSRFRARYVPAVMTYGGAAAVLGVVVLVVSPSWWSWVLVYAPLCAVALWLSWLRAERDVASGLATITAACLIPLVMGSEGLLRLEGLPVLGALALVCFGYFFGTVLYVKTILRKRGQVGWVVASVAWHLGCAVGALWVPAPLPAGWLVTFFVALALRALLVPLFGPMSGRRPDVMLVGIAEFVTTVLLVAILLPALVV